MADFWLNLEFSIVPLLAVLIVSIILTPIGLTLSKQQETMAALAFPQVAQALMLVVSSWLHVHHPIWIVGCILPGMWFFYGWGQSQWLKTYRSLDLYFALLLVASTALSILFQSMRAGHHEHSIKNILSGEIMAISTEGLLLAMALLLIGFVGWVWNRGAWLSFLIDPTHIAWRYPKVHQVFSFQLQMMVLLGLSVGSLLVGTLFTTAFLLVPAAFTLAKSVGLKSYYLNNLFISVLSVIAGFLIALIIDQPPVPTIVVTLVVVHGLISRIRNQ